MLTSSSCLHILSPHWVSEWWPATKKNETHVKDLYESYYETITFRVKKKQQHTRQVLNRPFCFDEVKHLKTRLLQLKLKIIQINFIKIFSYNFIANNPFMYSSKFVD